MKRVILTGGTGFVGANLARRLLREGHELHLLVRPNYQPWRIEQIRSEVRLHEVHLHDSEAVSRVVGQIRPDWVFHLAVHGAYSWQTDWEQMVRTNIQGTMSLRVGLPEDGLRGLRQHGLLLGIRGQGSRPRRE